MQIYISYFYQIRNFPETLIPVSTAVYDPKWYSNNGTPFLDKRGVVNGLRYEPLNPSKLDDSIICNSDCDKNYKECKFLSEYSKYLDTLDFNKIYSTLQDLASCFEDNDDKDIDVCLMVYETPDNPCSERVPLINYFKKHGIEVKEFNS